MVIGGWPWATKSEGVGLIVRAISSEISDLLVCDHIDQRYRGSTCDRKSALCSLQCIAR